MTSASQSDLFRPGAVEFARSKIGDPVRPLGVSSWALTIFLCALFVTAAVFLATGRYARKETVHGTLEPQSGAARVTALRSGVVAAVLATEGQLVAAGTPIARLSTDTSVSEAGSDGVSLADLLEQSGKRETAALAEEEAAQLDAGRHQLEELRVRQSGVEMDQAQLVTSMLLQDERIRLAQETFDAGARLHERELFSTLQLRQREEALIAARQARQALAREHQRNAVALAQIRTESGRLLAQMHQAQASIRVQMAQSGQRDATRRSEREILLTAPKAGTVAALQARPGTVVAAGQSLAVILPPGAVLQAELWAPSRSVGFLKRGDAVRLMYEAFPFQKFGAARGVVTSVARAPTNPADLPVILDTREPLYRVLVRLDRQEQRAYGQHWKLTPGMRVDANIVLENRTLWEWLIDPILAARRAA